MDILNLPEIAAKAKERRIVELFEQDSQRVDTLSVSAAGLYLDYSKQNINTDELNHLFELAKSAGLTKQTDAMFSGQHINNTENRAVLHAALRAKDYDKKAILDNADEVIQTEARMADIVKQVHNGELKGVTGRAYTDVVAIGIGGSFYGVKVALSALHPFHTGHLKVHVLANVDGAALQEKLEGLDAETTLVVVISKTFTTQETLLNATGLKEWMLSQSCSPEIIAKQWYAISSNVSKAGEFGLVAEHILPMWDWVGGRFSLWSAVGLPLALAIGNEHFQALKNGACAMDEHFKAAPFESNMPVLMALIGIWNRNALSYPSLAILPYDHALRALPGYLQQTDMESNGKSVAKDGSKLNWLTAPIVFGQEGTNGQHAFMQLMHQSDDVIPTDFIVCLKGTSSFENHHQVLVANCFAQSEALMQGKNEAQIRQELLNKGASEAEIAMLTPHKVMKGNTPSNTLILDELSPYNLGALLALYEHKIFVQGALWGVNSFDQWGVELGKELGNQVLSVMQGAENDNLSPSSCNLITRYLDNK